MAATRGALVQVEVTVAARADRLEALHAALDRFWSRVDETLPEPPDNDWRLHFATAMAEIGANIVRHAHPEGALPGIMQLRLRAFRNRIEARFADGGVPFRGMPEATPAPPTVSTDDDALVLAEGGYGLRLVLAAVDKLDYERTAAGRNHWRLTKRF